MTAKHKKKLKLHLYDSIGSLNLLAALLALFVLFFGIFNAEGLNVILYPLPFLVAFAACAYIARARFLMLKSAEGMSSLTVGTPILVIAICVWGFIFAL